MSTLISKIKLLQNTSTLLMLLTGFFLFFVFNFQSIAAQQVEPTLKKWVLQDKPPHAKNNKPTLERVQLGKKLFFDKKLSGSGEMACASCHVPELGWSDGQPTAIGKDGKILGRASPTIINAAYNKIQMWDGRKKSLIDQATGPLDSPDEMDKDSSVLVNELQANKKYKEGFEKAYPGEGINRGTIARAIAAFENTLVCNNSPFDRYVNGDKNALSEQQVSGFNIFTSPEKGNCATCHQAPNFTDDGFHNVGLKSFGEKNHDVGRYKIKPVRIMNGAFKTPSLRSISLSAPYFHDGSAKTLEEVVSYYVEGGSVKTNLSPDLEKLDISKREQKDLVSFLDALSCDADKYGLTKSPL